MFQSSSEDLDVAVAEKKLRNRATLAAVLGDGREWEYRGECNDLMKPVGKCSCGHEGIRLEFTIHHPPSGRTAIVGSSCIDTFGGVNPDMVAAIMRDVERLKREANERLKAAKALAMEREVQAALAEYNETCFALARITADDSGGYYGKRRVSGWIWCSAFHPATARRIIKDHGASGVWPTQWKQYKVKSAFIRAIKAKTEEVKRLAAGPIWE